MKTLSLGALALVSSQELTGRLYSLRVEERELLVEFLACLGELDKRKLYSELGFSSLFAYCMEHLGLSRSGTFRRTTAARLLMRFPVIAARLADGRLTLTNLVELRDVLCEEGLGEILDRAAGRTEDEVKVLAASLRPRPAPPDLFRRLPAHEPCSSSLELASMGMETTSPPPPTPSPPSPSRPPSRLEPISEELRVLRVTVGREFAEDLERVRAALSHVIPDRGLEKVLHECIRRTLRDVERRRAGGKARGATATSADGRKRYIPAAVRREVWRRDEGRCAFVSADGHRCASTHWVQFHHVVAHAKGGLSTVSNLSLRCASHNQHHAEHDFGPSHIARAIAESREGVAPPDSLA
jgi:hypothetical protein